MSIVTPKQIAKTIKLVADSDINSEQYQTLLESGEFTALLKEFTEINISTIGAFEVMVDYNMSLEQMIEAGKYDWVNEDIQRFPVKKRESGEVELYIVHFGCDMTTKRVLAEFDRQDLRPAGFSELLSLGIAHPNPQQEYTLIALGSEWQRRSSNDIYVPIVRGHDENLELDLSYNGPGNGWGGGCCFLAVKKSNAPAINVLKVMVDYDMSLPKMIKAGHYDYVGNHLTARTFPINKWESGEVELCIVHFGRDMTTEQILAKLDEQDLRPAELPELLALGSTFPNLQREYPLIALGSVWQRNHRSCTFVPILGGNADERGLEPATNNKWGDPCRFVAVRKKEVE